MVRSQKGITMAMVIFIIAVVFIIIATIFSYNTNSAVYVSNVNAMEEALHIAEAGINVYMYHLNQDPDFYRDKNGIHIAGNASSDELGLVPSEFDSNDLPKLYKVTTYKNKDTTVGYYQIRVVQPSFNKCLEIISTGWTSANPVIKKTVSVKLNNKTTLCGYLLFTNADSTFYTGSVIKGPVFSNGDIKIVGDPKFESDLISGGSISTVTGNPSIEGEVLENQPKKIFPTYNKEKIAESADLTFEGRTCILLNNSSLKIRNQNDGDILQTENITKPYTIFVEDGPVFISGTLDGRLTVYSTEEIYITGKDPTYIYEYYNNRYFDAYRSDPTGGIFYSNTNIPNENSSGDDFSDDMLGLISEKNIIIATRTWPHLLYGTAKADVGAVSTKNISIYGSLLTSKDIEIEDSYPDILNHESLNLYGSQACKNTYLQGNEGEGGYSKITNTYDYRLKTDYPPYMLNPFDSEWVIKAWEEVPNP